MGIISGVENAVESGVLGPTTAIAGAVFKGVTGIGKAGRTTPDMVEAQLRILDRARHDHTRNGCARTN